MKQEYKLYMTNPLYSFWNRIMALFVPLQLALFRSDQVISVGYEAGCHVDRS